MQDDIQATIQPSLFRRALAVGLTGVSGVLLIYLGLGEQTVGLVWKLLMVAGGAGVLFLADRLWRSTGRSIDLTEQGLVDSGGTVLCAFDNIAKVERSAFAFKPSNGLLIHLKTPVGRAWAPGLWWRFGRKIGIGGVTTSRQAKFMADMIVLRQAGLLPDRES